MHLRCCRKRQKISEVWNMELLVTKFSNGKYENEDELFAENISADNVKLMGEMIALRSLRTLKQYDFHVADKLYIGLIKDFHHMGEVGYAISEGYDCAQIAICFLWQFAGKSVHDVCCVDLKGNKITVKLACYREVAMYINRLRRKADKTDYIDFTDYKALPMDPVNCFEKDEWDYDKADNMIIAMQLTEAEKQTLDCYLNGMQQAEVARTLGLSIFGVKYRKMRVRQKCSLCIKP